MDGDQSKEQFDNFLANDVPFNRSNFKNFDFKVTRLNEFLKIYPMNREKYSGMWKVCIFIFTLSHGQSSIERGFSVNKDSLTDNLHFCILEAPPVCDDELIELWNNIKSFDITK